MTKQELIEKLKALHGETPETAHGTADFLLLEYIDDEEVTDAFVNVDRWYE